MTCSTVVSQLLRLWVVVILVTGAPISYAQEINARTLLPRTTLSVSPSTASVIEGSTFDVSIVLNTHSTAINGIQAHIRFDSSKLTIVQPSSGKSVIGVWVEPPTYDNARGTASYIGVVPAGITTNAGVVGTITFKAKAAGTASVSILSDSEVLLHDGLGTSADVELGRAVYTILPKPPEGVTVFSETHPFSSQWYQNTSPTFAWTPEEGVTGFSYVLDTKPSTIPENVAVSNETSVSYKDIRDGVWYFHIKALKRGAWGNTSHFPVRIDTTAPADFTPKVDHVFQGGAIDHSLLSFITTDDLSGVDHYEVAIVHSSTTLQGAPAFVESQSPFHLTLPDNGAHVVVRAIDGAGNVRDVSLQVVPPMFLTAIIKEQAIYILMSILIVILITIVSHYVFGHHVIRHFRRAWQLVQKEDQKEELKKEDFSTPLHD